MQEDMQYEMKVAGPDDVVVFSDELEALQRANDVNKQYLQDRMNHPDSEVLCVATVHEISESEIKPSTNKPHFCHKHGG